MPIFTAIATGVTAIATAIGFSAAAAATVGAVAAFAARTLLTIGISKLLVNRAGKTASGTQNVGARIQLPPATDNKLPVIYGQAFIGGSIIDAKLTTNQKSMYYVVALAEHTDTTVGSGYTFGDIYYDGKQVTFDGTDPAKVISLTTNTAGTPQVDTKIAGQLYIYLFTNGSSSGVNTGGQTAIQILSNSDIPADIRWNSSLYTSGGQSPTMTNTAFAIVKVNYNQEAGTTNLGSLTVELTNSLKQPGSVIKDYLQNTRYGCAIPLANIDTASLAALDAYSAQTITYIPVGGGSATQARYEVNGPLNTGIDCLTNLQQLVDSADSWLQYSELTGKWKVVINRAYTDTTTFANLYQVNSSCLIGGIEVNPIDLNSTFNIVEVQYPNKNIKDQTDFQTISLFTSYPSLLSPNEPINKLVVQYPQVNNAVQAKYLGLRRLLQGREDLVISFALDYSGIQIEAGDVIRVTLSNYGWVDKLFRVSNVVEEKYGDGSLGVRVTAFEYNGTIYADNSIQDFIPEANTGLIDPNIITAPNCPTCVIETNNTVAQMTITGTVPSGGLVTYMDFNYGSNSNVDSHLLYTTVSGNGVPFTANANISIPVTDLPTGNYWWSVAARNDSVAVRSNSCAGTSQANNWQGPTVTDSNIALHNCANSSGNIITVSNTANVVVNGVVTIESGTGDLFDNTRVTAVTGNTTFTINPAPNLALVCADIAIDSGGISNVNIKANTITGNNIKKGTITGNRIAANTVSSNNMTKTGVAANTYTNVANITVDDAGRIISVTSSAGGTLRIAEDGSPPSFYNVANLLVTGGVATVTQTALGNVSLDIPYTGNYVITSDAFTPGAATTLTGALPNVANIFTGSINQSVTIVGGIKNDGTGNYVSYSTTLPDDYYPARYGTASTANGFLANSSGVTPYFNPAGASWQTIAGSNNINDRGYYGWWGIIQSQVGSADIPGFATFVQNTQIWCSSELQLQSTSNTDVWYAPFATRFDGSTYDKVITYDQVGVISLTANVPVTLQLPLTWFRGNQALGGRQHGIGTGERLHSLGWALRVPDSGANVYVLSGSQTIFWNETMLNSW